MFVKSSPESWYMVAVDVVVILSTVLAMSDGESAETPVVAASQTS